jgi:SAM-dependent methyltransferase
MIALINKTRSTLEIGPFLKPRLKRQDFNVKYFDVLNKEQNIARAQRIIDAGSAVAEEYMRNIQTAPDIDFVDESGNLAVISEKYSAIFSSHCIEHQVDLVDHINQVHDLLLPGGRYFLVVPDKRYCFDHFIPETRLIDLIAGNLDNRRYHSPLKVLEHRLYLTHNNAQRHWSGDHGEPNINIVQDNFIINAIKEASSANNRYIDVHNLAFTPLSFENNVSELHRIGLVKMFSARVYPTLRNTFEFMAVLQKPTHMIPCSS